MTSPIQLALQVNQHSAQTGNAIREQANGSGLKLFGEDGLTFADLIDVINPLQHIPLIGGLYRKLTGDTIDPAMRIAGGALFGGPIGAGLSAASVAFENASKNDKAAEALLDDQNMPLSPDQSIAKTSSYNSSRGVVETVYGLKSIPQSREAHVNNDNLALLSNQAIVEKSTYNPGRAIVETTYGLKSVAPSRKPSEIVVTHGETARNTGESMVNKTNQSEGEIIRSGPKISI